MTEFEFDSTPETDAMLKQICIKECFVRCKDCIWGFENANGTILCERTSNADCFVEMPLNGFCSEGTTDENAEWGDMETAVHCKDCKYWAEFTFNVPPFHSFHYCGRLFQDGNTESIGFYMEADDYCSRGERK